MNIRSLIVTAVLATAILCSGGVINAQATTDNSALIAQLQAQIASLMAQISALQGQQGTSTSTTWCYTFDRNLGFAESGTTDVSFLHAALKKQNISYGSDADTIYTEATAIGVRQFQAKYGLTQNGYVGVATRAKLNSLYSCSLAKPACSFDGDCPQPAGDRSSSSLISRCVNGSCVLSQNNCNPHWTCGWGPCINGSQIQTQIDSNNCGMPYGNGGEIGLSCPAMGQTCTPITVLAPAGGEQLTENSTAVDSLSSVDSPKQIFEIKWTGAPDAFTDIYGDTAGNPARVNAYLEQNVNGKLTTMGRIIPSAYGSIMWIIGEVVDSSCINCSLGNGTCSSANNCYAAAPSLVPPGTYDIKIVDNQTGASGRSNNFLLLKQGVSVLKISAPAALDSQVYAGGKFSIQGWNFYAPDTVYVGNELATVTQEVAYQQDGTGLIWAVAPSDLQSGSSYVVVKNANGTSNQVKVTTFASATQPIVLTSPTPGSTLVQGKTYNVTWTGSESGVTDYAVYLVGGNLGSAGSIYLGDASASLQSFSWTVPTTVAVGSGYNISLSGKGATGNVPTASTSFSIAAPVACLNGAGALSLGQSYCSQPSITSLSASSGTPGTVITVYGSNFSTSVANQVTFDNPTHDAGIPGVTSSDGKTVTFTVFPNASSADLGSYSIFVENTAGQQSNKVPFTIIPSVSTQPSITVTPNSLFLSNNISPNTQNVKIGSYIIQNTSTSASVRVNTLEIGQAGTLALTDMTGLKTSDTSTNLYVIGAPTGDDLFSVNDNLSPGASMTLDVFASVGPVTSGTIQTKLTVSAIEMVGYNQIKSTTVSGQTMTLASSAQPSITVTSPNGGEQWVQGSTHNITWTANFLSSKKVWIRLINRASGVESVISDATLDSGAVLNSGSFQWVVPTTTASGTNYYIEIMYGWGDIPGYVQIVNHSNPFTITAPATVVNGVCGSANGVAVSSTPTTNLCSSGTASIITGTCTTVGTCITTGPWTWACVGSGNGTTASCLASVATTPLALSCSVSPNPVQVGSSATFTATTSGGTGSYTYSWSGACTGTSQTCSNSFSTLGTQTASVTATSGSYTSTAICNVNSFIPGGCGTAAKSYSYLESTLLGSSCLSGSSTPSTPAFPAQGGSTTWTCPGSNGDNITCTATRSAAPVVVHTALTATCSPSATSSVVGQPVTWSATNVSGGTGTGYTYAWSGSGAFSGTGSTVTNTYTAAGTKNAYLTVDDSASSFVNITCPTVTVTTPPTVITYPQTSVATTVQNTTTALSGRLIIPTGLTATVTGSCPPSVQLSWNPTGDSTSYNIYRWTGTRRTGATIVVNVVNMTAKVAGVSVTHPSFTDTTVVPGTQYEYAMYTKDDSGKTSPWNITGTEDGAVITTPACSTASNISKGSMAASLSDAIGKMFKAIFGK